MKFTEIAHRLTGISSPFFGVSWVPPEADVTIAKRVLTFLEDRRVLFAPTEMEVPDHCIQSVLTVRAFVTEQLSSLDPGHDLAPPLRAIRAACRKFLDQMQGLRDRPISLPTAPSTIGRMDAYDAWVFCGALGEMRGVVGVHVAQIAARYRLDVDDELAAILPAGDSP